MNETKQRALRPISKETAQQIADTYLRIAKCDYRPAAPSDGVGNIDFDNAKRLNAEAIDYIADWRRREDSSTYIFGCPNWSMRPAMMLSVAIAELCCGGLYKERETRSALLLAKELVRELEDRADVANR